MELLTLGDCTQNKKLNYVVILIYRKNGSENKVTEYQLDNGKTQ